MNVAGIMEKEFIQPPKTGKICVINDITGIWDECGSVSKELFRERVATKDVYMVVGHSDGYIQMIRTGYIVQHSNKHKAKIGEPIYLNRKKSKVSLNMGNNRQVIGNVTSNSDDDGYFNVLLDLRMLR